VARVGRKFSDRRWEADDGTIWASKFEHDVYYRLAGDGYRIRKCDESDSVAYQSSIKSSVCLECGSSNCVQLRTYTPDLYVVGGGRGIIRPGSVVECKGKFTGDKRNLFRQVAAQWEGSNLCIIFQGNRLPGLKSSSIEWCQKFCKDVRPGLWHAQTKKSDAWVEWFPKGKDA